MIDELPSLGRYALDRGDPQALADVAVVIPTICRPELVRAVRSIYAQDFAGRVQLLIGVDRVLHSRAVLDEVLAERPDHVSVFVLELPYSTRQLTGGVHTSLDGGSLRAVLSYMANSQFVAYLDDDNQWLPDHLSKLKAAIRGKAWAFSRRRLIDEESGEDLGVDHIDSVGPDRGRYAEEGGLVDTNCLLIDKLSCSRAVGHWAEGVWRLGEKDEGGERRLHVRGADRNVTRALRAAPFGELEDATVLYYLRRTNELYRLITDRI